MKKLIPFILFLLFLILAWFSWNWYKQTVVCCEKAEVKEEVIAEVAAFGPLVFNCDSDEPITNDLWPEKKTEILSGKAEGKKLLIVGPYFDGEEESVGISRANKIKSLFNELTEEDFEIGARKAGDCASTKSNLLHESQFKWVTRNDNIVEHFDKTLIYFEYNSSKEISSEQIIAYLNKLSEHLKSSKKSVILTGHTDADGTSKYNTWLGLRRANQIKSYLVKNGVSPEQITTNSKGQSEPIADNTTEEGKQKNRRVEVKVN